MSQRRTLVWHRLSGLVVSLGLAAALAHGDDRTLWETGSSRNTARKEPSFFDKVGSGTKKLWTDTKDLFSLNKSKPQPKTRSVYNPYAPKPEQKSWTDSMFGSKPAPPPKSLNEWMSLKRADP